MNFTALQHAAYVADAREAYALYDSMRTAELLELQAAFRADTAASAKPETIAFGAGRLALIAAVLKARASRGTSDNVGPVGLSDPVAP